MIRYSIHMKEVPVLYLRNEPAEVYWESVVDRLLHKPVSGMIERSHMNHSDPYYEEACHLHREVPVVDAHNDLAGELLLRHQRGEERVIERLYLPHWKAAGFQFIVSSIYIENSIFFPDIEEVRGIGNAEKKDWNYYWNRQALCWDAGFANALAQIREIKKELAELPEELCLITCRDDLTAIRKREKIGILLYMEGLDCIGVDVSRIHTLYQLGVRGASLTWSRPNLLAVGCCSATKHTDIPGPITSLGWQVLEALQQHHMFLDISHLNHEGWEQIDRQYTTEYSRRSSYVPYIATHSNSCTVYSSYRNLTDRQMNALASQGGIMGLNACKYIVGCDDPADYLDAMCCHMEYIVNKIHATHLGFGFDLCDSYSRARYRIDTPSCGDPSFPADRTQRFLPEDCLQNHKEALLLTARLLKRGMHEQNVLRILGLNWLEYFALLLE